jgi:hypothetical protein
MSTKESAFPSGIKSEKVLEALKSIIFSNKQVKFTFFFIQVHLQHENAIFPPSTSQKLVWKYTRPAC